MLRFGLGGGYLLKVSNGVKKLSAELQVGTQPPIKEKKQQGDKSNYKEVFQIALSTIRTYRGRLSRVRRRPLDYYFGI
jgi:hypothetical protein